MISNDSSNLHPSATVDGGTLTFDFPGLLIGLAEYPEGPTGCTVFCFPKGVATAIDERGGTVGSMGNYSWNHAICFAGGSLYGLEAASGVAAELFARGGYATDSTEIVKVSGATIHDFATRENAIYPDKELGRAAVKFARQGEFRTGKHGAGRSAAAGRMFGQSWREASGQGGAFCQKGPTKIGVFTVVNAVGALIDRKGRVVLGNLDPRTGERRHYRDAIMEEAGGSNDRGSRQGNTTLTLVVTNQKLSDHSLGQFARQVHSSMARAIQPFHTIWDGDILYATTTNEIENEMLAVGDLGYLASEVAWDAVLSVAEE